MQEERPVFQDFKDERPSIIPRNWDVHVLKERELRSPPPPLNWFPDPVPEPELINPLDRFLAQNAKKDAKVRKMVEAHIMIAKLKEEYKAPTVEEFLEMDAQGWLHLEVPVQSLHQLDYWALSRATPNKEVKSKKGGVENFTNAQKKIHEENQAKMLLEMAHLPKKHDIYMTLSILKLAYRGRRSEFPYIYKEWRLPTKVIEFYSCYQWFEKSTVGWHLPVPPLHSLEAHSSWYFSRICKHFLTKEEEIIYKAISLRREQAINVSFLFCFQREFPLQFEQMMRMPSEVIAKWYKYFETLNYFVPVYHLVDRYAKYLAHPYFNSVFSFHHDGKQVRHIVSKIQVHGFENVTEDFMREFELDYLRNCSLHTKIGSIKEEFKHAIKKAVQIVIPQEKYEPVLIQQQWISQYGNEINRAVNFHEELIKEKKEKGIVFRGNNDPLNTNILAKKYSGSKKYSRCPVCGVWLLVEKDGKCKQHQCWSPWNTRLTITPRSIPHAGVVELFRKDVTHGLALCLRCHTVYEARGPHSKIKCKPVNHVIVDFGFSLLPKPYTVIKNSTYELDFSLAEIQNEQPIHSHMIYGSNITAIDPENELPPELEVVTLKNNRKALYFKQTFDQVQHDGIITLQKLEYRTSFGFVGGHLFPLNFKGTDTQTILGRDAIACVGEFSESCFAPIQKFTGLSFCRKSSNMDEANCQLVFGLYNNEVKAVLRTLRVIYPNQHLIVLSRIAYAFNERLVSVEGKEPERLEVLDCGALHFDASTERIPNDRILEIVTAHNNNIEEPRDQIDEEDDGEQHQQFDPRMTGPSDVDYKRPE